MMAHTEYAMAHRHTEHAMAHTHTATLPSPACAPSELLAIASGCGTASSRPTAIILPRAPLMLSQRSGRAVPRTLIGAAVEHEESSSIAVSIDGRIGRAGGGAAALAPPPSSLLEASRCWAWSSSGPLCSAGQQHARAAAAAPEHAAAAAAAVASPQDRRSCPPRSASPTSLIDTTRYGQGCHATATVP